jgi:hypothetical protein
MEIETSGLAPLGSEVLDSINDISFDPNGDSKSQIYNNYD